MSPSEEDPLAWVADLPEKPSASKLEPYADAIRELRKKRYTYVEIAQLLNERFGLSIHPTSVLRFLQKERKPAKKNAAAKGTPAPRAKQNDSPKKFSFRPGQSLDREEK